MSKNVSQTKTIAESLETPRTTADALFSGIEWTDAITGFCPCPGQNKHTTPNGDRDCRIKIDGTPTISCVHASCVEEIKIANKTLRDAVKSSLPVENSAERKAAAALAKSKARFEEELRVRTRSALPGLLKTFEWPYEAIIADHHPVYPDDRQGMFQAFLDLFDAGDVIWIGDVASTGQAQHAFNFKTKEAWGAGEMPTGSFTCPSCFAPNSISRSKENVMAQRYLVIESDTLSKNEVGAIFRWLGQGVGLRLRAVVDTAGKSLHGWFEYPRPEVLQDLKIMLPVMGCDPKMFGASQPCRLPGGLRDGRIQRLIFSRKGGVQ